MDTTTTQAGFTGALASHFARLETEQRERLSEATSCYWNSVASAADGEGAPTADEAKALGEAMTILGPSYSLKAFQRDMAELQRLRDLRSRGDVEAASEEKEKLRTQWAEVSKRVVKAREKLAALVAEEQRLGSTQHRLVPRANEIRREADQLAKAMREAGAGVLEELGLQPHETEGRLARIRVLNTCFVANSRRQPGDVIEMPLRGLQPHMELSSSLEFLGWAADQEQQETEAKEG